MMSAPIHTREARDGGPELTSRHQRALMNTFGEPQRVLVQGRGCHVWDADGNRYLDLLAGIAVNALGHGHPALVTAVTEQMNTLGHISNFFASEPQIQLAERLLTLLHADDDSRVFLTNSGTEANEAAFKATRQTGRKRIVATEGCFHGRTMGALALTWKADYREPFEPLPGDITWVPYGDAAALEAAVDDTVAAVILEPIQGEAGVIVPPVGYLKTARRITEEHGALLWLDEIQTGVGRTGLWFEHLREEITPDLVTLAKGLGGGIPIGACVGLGRAGSLFGPGNHGTTFGGNPVAAAASLAVLDTIENEALLDHVNAMSALLSQELSAVPGVARVDGRGLLLGIVLDEPIAAAVQTGLLSAGVIVNAPTPDRLRLAPPLVLSESEAHSAIATMSRVIQETSA